MDSRHHIVLGDMWNATWFLTVREIWPCKVGIPKNGQEALVGYKSMIEKVKWLKQ
jgi:hypothetical protein